MSRDEGWAAADYVVVDVEGNGARLPHLVELALVPVRQGRIGTARTWLVRPADPITWQATRVHGITNDDVAEAPPVRQIAAEVLEVLGDAVLVGHAVHVDVDVLSRSLPGWVGPVTIDTLRLARRVFDLPSYSLSALVEHRHLDGGLPEGSRPHRAGYDATVTARLFVDIASNLSPGGATQQALMLAGGPADPLRDDVAQPTLFDPLRPITTP
ncbi:exodeoxyribonuclease X [Promicromonospora sp. AC04]|uniref:3'-5' exonuclease n=1 Tax=Promicromonospora sp. AC04 TaxID=2135723 RepID=UPI000D4D1C35|nr:3'-5' exonuclease [Promicromonospora sp. AC04]PUB32568.1 exodeoxyribonuclease X [Promicromonospora sp. AC04]